MPRGGGGGSLTVAPRLRGICALGAHLRATRPDAASIARLIPRKRYAPTARGSSPLGDSSRRVRGQDDDAPYFDRRFQKARMNSSFSRSVIRRNDISSSPSENVTLAADVGSAAQRARLRVDSHRHDARRHAVGAEDLELVAAAFELLERRGGNAALDLEDAGLALVIVEGAERMQRVDPRSLDRLLEPHL